MSVGVSLFIVLQCYKRTHKSQDFGINTLPPPSLSPPLSLLFFFSLHLGTGPLKAAEEVAYGELQEATANCSERGGLPKALRTDKNEN